MTMKKQSGFTLIEVMVAVVIMAITIAIGVPGLRNFVHSNRIIAINNDLVSALHLARSEAIRQDASACVCPSANANQAVPVCSNSSNWETGWIAFLDFNGNCTIDNGAVPDVLLKIWDGAPYAGQVTVRNDNASINGSNTILFNSRGEPQLNGINQQGVFSICDERPISVDAQGRSGTSSGVVLGISGQIRTTRLASLLTYTSP